MAAIVFKGESFVPGAVYAHRRRSESGGQNESNDYFWHLPTIYFGDYLEVASVDSGPESSLSWRNYEFAVRNPEGQMSEWVLFSYPFDDNLLEKNRIDSFNIGSDFLNSGKPVEAVEPLRKAYVFSDRMFGIQAHETLEKKALWEHAVDEAARSKLRFRVDDYLRVISGPHVGKKGVVCRLLLRHLHAYLLKSIDGEEFQASDMQVEIGAP